MFDPTLKQCTTLFINQNLVYVSHQFIGPVEVPTQQCFTGKGARNMLRKSVDVCLYTIVVKPGNMKTLLRISLLASAE